MLIEKTKFYLPDIRFTLAHVYFISLLNISFMIATFPSSAIIVLPFAVVGTVIFRAEKSID